MTTPSTSHDTFVETFERHARRTRARLFARYALHGIGFGLFAASALVAAYARWGSPGSLRAFAVGAGVAGLALGAGGGSIVARKKRWSDGELALFFDRRLGTNEAIVTAIEVEDARDARQRARSALDGAAPTALVVPVFRRAHAAAALSLVTWLLAARVPHARADVPPVEPGAANVTLGAGSGLERVERLATVPARDPAQRERLLALSKDAKKLREDLTKGLPRRDAQDRAGKLAEAVRAERVTLGSGEERKGLEAAIAALSRDDTTRRTAAALGDHDLHAMDRELEHHANAREAADRTRAKQALEAAKNAAKSEGAPGVAKALEDALSKNEKREARARMLRELGQGTTSPTAKDALKNLDRAPSDANAKALAEALADALEGLTEAERKKLAEALGKMAASETDPTSAKELDALAKELATDEGRAALARRLRELADRDDSTEEESRDQSLSEAEQGIDGTEGALGSGGGGERGDAGSGQTAGAAGSPGGPPGGGASAGAGAGSGLVPAPGAGGGAAGSGGSGSHHDTGTGDHTGRTEALGGAGFKARAKGPTGRGPLMPGTTTAWKPGDAQGTADAVGTKALESARANEVQGADRGDVPEDYREQIHRYFRP